MGGGGRRAAMRAAAKAAGTGIGIRGGEIPVSAAAATRAVASVVSSNDSGDLKIAVANSNVGKVNSSVLKPYADIGELFMDMHRLVSSGAPTIQEAIQATSELNAALEMTYLSPNNNKRLKDSEDMETKPCLVSETATHSPPNHALQAFRFFSETPAARNLVASLASDPKVCEAFAQNKEFIDFIQEYQTNISLVTPNDSSVWNAVDSFVSNVARMLRLIGSKMAAAWENMQNSFSEFFLRFFGKLSKGVDVARNAMRVVIMVILATVLKRPHRVTHSE